MEVAKLVTQPFYREQMSARLYLSPSLYPRPTRSLPSSSSIACSAGSQISIVGVGSGSTYVALEGALENKLLSHIEFFVEIGSTKRRSGGLEG